ncbi:tetratricopeptide repeat protein [Pajaroellobacter abortibovis]|uniref:Tetratricopeptide repeat protein n=1 Tax=Pajaroellobacter abortibovis TaxID=1882918 RepID=A0A1L6MUZ3_9BACT|nr:hypothetical protein [Pajaroellobacter abortibovis]APR99333.1 hypothetical protein BCY86_00555 [Pajaroellobacter abortibovis]
MVIFSACHSSFKAQPAEQGVLVDKWVTCASQSYYAGEWDDAVEASRAGLQIGRENASLKIIAARLALARLEFNEAIQLTSSLEDSEAYGIRWRAHWFQGEIEQAADELEEYLKAPSSKDMWAKEISRLARKGIGRHPFTLKGDLVVGIDMPRAGSMVVVPCELEGEQVFAVMATASSEVIIDSSTRKESAWVNLRFGGRIEVQDVPAIAYDLSGISRQLGAPIRLLLGTHFLRRTHVTWDRSGDQFVIRKEAPDFSLQAARIPLWYADGGAMLLPGRFAAVQETGIVLSMDSLAPYSIAFEEEGWKMLSGSFSAQEANRPVSVLPSLALGTARFSDIVVRQGVPIPEIPTHLPSMRMIGMVGGGLFSTKRVTIGEEGRCLWIENGPFMEQGSNGMGLSSL